MADQIIERAGRGIRGQPGVLNVALDEAALLKNAADAQGDLFDPPLRILCTRLGHLAEHRRRGCASVPPGRTPGRPRTPARHSLAAACRMRREAG